MIRKIAHFFTEGIPPRKNFPQGHDGLARYINHLFTAMPPGLRRLMRLQPLLALGTGLALVFLLRKGFDHVPLVIVFIVLSFCYITYRLYLHKREEPGIMTRVWDIALVFLLNDMLLFVAPFYFESMTPFSRNIAFAPFIAILIVIANWYYLYQRFVQRHPLISAIFYAMTFFCVLNFIFPIVFGMRNIWSLLLSAGIAAATVIIYVYPHMSMIKNIRNTLAFFLGILLSMAGLWFGRSLIPPSPLKLIHATACEGIEGYRPKNPFSSGGSAALEEAYFYSRIFAPRGLSEKIDHVWYHNGNRLFTVSLSEIRGGRREGFSTWSRHKMREGPGRYLVEVWTAGGQLLGIRYFTVR